MRTRTCKHTHTHTYSVICLGNTKKLKLRLDDTVGSIIVQVRRRSASLRSQGLGAVVVGPGKIVVRTHGALARVADNLLPARR